MDKLNVGQSFAEYDPALGDPNVYVHTPAFNAALDPSSGKYFFVGRRGTGKTALRSYCELHGDHARVVIPEIFSPASTAFDLSLFQNPRKGPFRALVSAFKRVLLGELLLLWREHHRTYAELNETVSAELEGPCQVDFDTRALSAIAEVARAVASEDDQQIVSANKQTKSLVESMKQLRGGGSYTLLIDSIDDFWDASDQALTYLTAFLHACLEVSTQIPWARALIFLRENIFERVRARDSESSRLETSIAGLGWTQRQLVELVEKRLNRALTAKIALGGATWDAFFEDGAAARRDIFDFCHDRPRDVLIYVSHAIDGARERGHDRILLEDVEGARRKFSDNRLKDLGDEYAENYPQIAVVLTRFYGLGQRFTLSGIEALIRGLLADGEVKRLCASWIFDNQAPELFVRLLYNIGFVGLQKPGRSLKFRALGPQDTSPPAIDSDVTIEVHKCYWDALDLQDSLVRELPEATELGRVGLVSELPGGLNLTEYQEHLVELEERLDSIPLGRPGAKDFEEAVGDVLRLCFFRALENVESRVRTVDGEAIRDWVAAIRAHTGFWARIRHRYNAMQAIWECKNYQDLKADDFQQVSYYLSDAMGKFAVIAFRGEMQASYLTHIKRISSDKGGLVLPLGIRDLKVFVRQAKNGKLKEDHIEDRYDAIVRKIS
ncbi:MULTISPECIES: P-loop ATPase, Sll1717 family [Micromonospora]|uniref:P-loop ATPase, Sll1717 family n=1 Tax=Micromonospora TaxID=1873 RepID=UPI00248C5BC6|nr:hypothetical protein [Micromonospora sp. WMMC264]WBB84488.1 hypothetical protein O7542_24615 [Micromonospora sp. WMMC264]